MSRRVDQVGRDGHMAAHVTVAAGGSSSWTGIPGHSSRLKDIDAA
ncbi:hypothetical protein FM114_13425 [Luteococcus japonicus LSP_Lj1]|uniref:Uncharacterized protein n=1 Tax=Luteococcus japonicus LSP_Lj1 TaxID=1255658 RepID=A0A1R4KE11_9ACTN|nr:hypothetical protein FM114_13425 [Luteococcus japonicus LSP_Lj1]